MILKSLFWNSLYFSWFFLLNQNYSNFFVNFEVLRKTFNFPFSTIFVSFFFLLYQLKDSMFFTSKNSNQNIQYDPSAGSPTATLLRLLLPLEEKVWRSLVLPRADFSDTDSSPFPSPFIPIVRSDGLCVQRPGTKSALDADQRLLGIPRSRSFYRNRSQSRKGLQDSPNLSIKYFKKPSRFLTPTKSLFFFFFKAFSPFHCSTRAAQDS